MKERCYETPTIEEQSPVDYRVCEKVIMHDVNHIMPIHTKVINRHVFRHSYTPVFTCEEMDVCENIINPCQKNF